MSETEKAITDLLEPVRMRDEIICLRAEIERLRWALWHVREDLAHLVQQIDAAPEPSKFNEATAETAAAAENAKLHRKIDELASIIRGEEDGREYAATALEPKP